MRALREVEELWIGMEANERTPSVIARLMGFNELLPQQPIHRPIRVLSENYLQKTASIGLVRTRSSYNGHSSWINIEKQQEVKDAFGVQVPNYRKNQIWRKSEKTTSQRKLLRSIQKLENDSNADSFGRFDTDYLHKKLTSPLELRDETWLSPTRIETLRPNFGKARNAAGSFFSPSSDVGSPSCDRKHLEFSRSSNGKPYDEATERKNSVNGMEFFRRNFSISTSIAKKSAQRISHSISCRSQEVFIPEYRVNRFHRGLCLRREKALPGAKNEVRKPNFYLRDVSNMQGSKFCCEKSQSGPLRCSNNHNVQDVFPIHDEVENKLEDEDFCVEKALDWKLSSAAVPSSNSDYNQPIKVTHIIQDELENIYEEKDVSKDSNSGISNSSVDSLASVRMVSDLVADGRTGTVGIYCGVSGEQLSVPAPCILLGNDKNSSSHVWDASTGQKSLFAFPEERLVPSNCTKNDPEFSQSSEEAYQPSPNSVLASSFEEDTLSGSECFESASADMPGMWMQLQLLKSDSEDTHSEGSGMAVSSDGDTGGEYLDHANKNRKFVGMFSTEESRDFSYLVNALDEAGFQGVNFELCSETWYSPECPLSPLIFDALEKKYGEQMSWEESERRLLFDRVNIGLLEILNPCLDSYIRAKPLRRQFGTSLRRDKVEDELWKLLVSQEKELSKDLTEKALGRDVKWLDYADDISVICTEIEKFLFDELAGELVSNFSK